jgi:hypothetical protein
MLTSEPMPEQGVSGEAEGRVGPLPGSPPDYPMEKHYVVNPGWFKRVGSQVRLRQRAKYGWSIPKVE